jgi:hypothetical protein
MILTQDEGLSFFKMYLPLLHFAYSRKHYINFNKFKSTGIRDKMAAQKILFDKIQLIDEYLSKVKLNDQTVKDICEIKKHRKSKFIILKHLSQYSVFMDMNNRNKLYGVIGLTDELFEILPFFPIMIHGVIFNFRNKLVCDGLITNENIQFGPGIRKDLNREYKELKAKKGISLIL